MRHLGGQEGPGWLEGYPDVGTRDLGSQKGPGCLGGDPSVQEGTQMLG